MNPVTVEEHVLYLGKNFKKPSLAFVALEQ